ncbi:MAG: replicative DNA helicase, partial [Christensenellaceae bacterium]|nr:replicative DNA helicase [Christensenellaceae bacterium]
MQRQDTIYALPPHNIDAEKSVIGSILQDGNAVSYSIENLIADDFYMPENKAVFQAVTTLNSIGTPIDLMTVSNELQRIGKLDGIGGTAYLLSVIDYVPTTANIKSYVNIVVEKSTLRKLITACKNISNSCYTQEEPLSTILSSAEKQIYD